MFKTRKLIAALAIALLVGSCSDNFEGENNPVTNEITISEKTFDDFMLDKTFSNVFSQIKREVSQSQHSSLDKSALEEDFDFIISKKIGKMIKTDSIISYTFLVTRDTPSTEYFENLIIQTHKNNKTTAFIRQYSPSEPIKEFAEHDSFVFKGVTKTTQLKAEIIVENPGHETYSQIC